MGVKSQAANVVMGIGISIVLSRLTNILYYIPKGTLGAVVCSAMITLIDWPEFIKASRRKCEESNAHHFNLLPR